MSKIVAIVGRPNVGKSTLFNRLTESRSAIVDPTSGVTRDRHYGEVIWGDKSFTLIDTGGMITGSDDVFEQEINAQVELAIEEAAVILFLVDVNSGITDLDQKISKKLRKASKPVILVVNKVDNASRRLDASEFYNLGRGDFFMLSSTNGSGTGDLLDQVIKNLPSIAVDSFDKDEQRLPRFTVVGRPNVGKSSLTNVLLGEDRAIVNPKAGTTRDSVDRRYKAYGFDFFLVDTAGLRKKAKVRENIEFYSVMRSIKAIENSDVCILMIDAEIGIHAQDINILGLIQKNNKGVILVVNKWDLIEKDHTTTLAFEEKIREKTAPFTDYPIVFTSVLTKQRIHKVLEQAVDVFQRRKVKIKTSSLNEEVLPILKNAPPPMYKGKVVNIKFITQLSTPYPSFGVFCNLPQYVRDPYKRFVENKMRKTFDFSGVPINLFFRKS